MPPYLILLLLMGLAVFAIVTDHRFDRERTLRNRFGIDRDWWVPLLVLSVASGLSLVSWSAFSTALLEKGDILAMILAFGVLAEGLRASGLFTHIAYKVVAWCDGETSTLILAIFTMTSLVTVVTSNDIVVLVITPIIVAICVQARIQNAKLLLLSQFIAANTLSMGMLIGSPTNLIIAEELQIDFFTYALIMTLPALIAFGASFFVIYGTIWIVQRDTVPVFEEFTFDPQYTLPAENPEPEFTAQMRDWVILFTVFVGAVAVVTYLQQSLFWCAVPSSLLALLYWHRSDRHTQRVQQPLKRLPYGIIFFGLTFFTLAEAVSRTAIMTTHIIPAVQNSIASSPPQTAIAGVFASGILVNLFNDLPAAALLAQLFSQLHLENGLTELLLVQASLIGVNLGTYVTQVGALAGLIWFTQLRIHRQEQATEFPSRAETLVVPTRLDLVRYGFLHFCVAALCTGLFLALEWLVLSTIV